MAKIGKNKDTGSAQQGAAGSAADTGSTQQGAAGSLEFAASGSFEVFDNNVTLDTVYNAIQEMIFTKDTQGRITSANDIYLQHTSLSKEELLGKTAFDLKHISRAGAENITKVDKQVMETCTPYLNRQWMSFQGGAMIYVEQLTTPLVNEDGTVCGVLVTIKDLTELKLMMDEIRRQNDILEIINKVSQLLLEPDINVLENSIYEVLEIIGKGINADCMDIWRLHSDEGRKYYLREYGWSSDSVTESLISKRNPDDSLDTDDKVIPFMENMFSKGRSINTLVKNMPEAAREKFRKNGLGAARSALIMPIIFNDEYWGFIGAFDLAAERTFTENEELLLRSSQRMIAGSITHMNMTKDLMLQTDRLQYELTSKQDFFARMSHEIRTPLNAILGMTELALRERMSNVANEHIMTVKQTGMNLLSIVNDILDFSKIESGNMEVINADYSLSSLVYDIISIIRVRLAYTRLRFIVDVDSSLPCGLIGDEGKIRQILINLLSNAVKYTQSGFVKLIIRGESEDDLFNLEMVVKDSGKGIKEEDQAKLFRDYIQVDHATNIGIEGVGLGLSITHGLVTAMGGTISLKSVYGEGSEFTVIIPQMIEDHSRLAEVKEPENKDTLIYERRSLYIETIKQAIENLGISCNAVSTPEDVIEQLGTGRYKYLIGTKELLTDIKYKVADVDKDFQIIGIAEFGDEFDSEWRTLSTPIHTISLANVYNGEPDRFVYSDDESASLRFSAPEAKVLVVDDIETNLKVAAGLLSIFDVDIDISSNGPEAIEMIKDNRYDIIFMDHRMPGMDGVEAAEKIRAMGSADTYFSEVPIVMLTANVMSNVNMLDMFTEAGFNDFIAKPIDTIVLDNVMRKWIPKSKQRRYYAVETADADPMPGLSGSSSLSIPGVDVEKGFRTAGNKMDLYLEILATFSDEAAERVSQIHEYAEAGNLRMFTVTTHALKGALANIGADELAATAAKLEAAGDRKDSEYVEQNNERFTSGVSRLLVNIKSVLDDMAKNVGEGKSAGKAETERFLQTLEELKEALGDMNAGTMNRALESLISDAHSEQALSTVRLISKHILMAEYDDAEQVVDELIATLKA